MNENEFELDGKVYVRIPNGECANCCFNCADSGGKCLEMPCISENESYREKPQ